MRPEAIIEQTGGAIGPLDAEGAAGARARHARLTKPPGSLGRLEELGIRLAGITGEVVPSIGRRVVIVCAADHGVTVEGVSAYPAAVTAQMIYNLVRGGAAISVLARRARARVLIADLGVNHDFPADLPIVHTKLGRGTANMARGPAMSRPDAARAVAAGIRLAHRAARDGAPGGRRAGVRDGVARDTTTNVRRGAGPQAGRSTGCTVVGTGDMGIGNTTAASAIVAALSGAPARDVTGRGTGIDRPTWERKVAVIERALTVNRPDPADPLDVLAKVGGYEIGAIAGVILGGAARRRPVVIDGFISGAAALLAVTLCPAVREYLIPAHVSVEIGHRLVLERLKLVPLLSLDLRLGEGTGAAMAMHLLDDAVAVLRDMATFGEAGVAGPLPDAVAP